MFKLLSLIAVIILGIFFIREWNSQTQIIRRFEIASEVAEIGYTPRAVQQQLLDEINGLLIPARGLYVMDETIYGVRNWVFDFSPDFVIPNTSVSMESAVAFVKQVFGRYPAVVSGEVVVKYEQLQLNIRVTNSSTSQQYVSKHITGTKESLDSILVQGAMFVVETMDPIALILHTLTTNSEKALELIKIGIANEPHSDDVVYYNLWGRLLIHLNKNAEAIEKFKSALSLDSTHSIVNMNLGLTHLALGDTTEATARLQRAVALDPTNKFALFNMGMQRVRLNLPDKGESFFQKALAIDAYFAWAWYGASLSQWKQGDTVEALQMLEKATIIEPNSPRFAFHLGHRLMQRGHLKRAIEFFERAIAIDSGYAEAYTYLGYCFGQVGQNNRALEVFSLGALLVSGKVGSLLYYNWAQVLGNPTGLGDTHSAISKLRRAIEIDTLFADAYYLLGVALSMIDNQDGACLNYNRYLELAPLGEFAKKARDYIQNCR